MPRSHKTAEQLLDEVTVYVVTLTYMETKQRFTPDVIDVLRNRLAAFAAATKAAGDAVPQLPDPEKWAHIQDARKTAPEMPRAKRESDRPPRK